MRTTGSIVVETPPAGPVVFTTIGTVRAYLNMPPNPDASDLEMLNHLMLMSAEFIQNYCGRKFARQEVTESLPGDGSPDMLISITPIVSVASVMYDEGLDTDFIIKDKESGILEKRSGWTDTHYYTNYLNPAPTSYAEYRWHVRYTGGFNLPGWPAPAVRDFPYDLERACVEIIRSGYKQAKTGADPAMTTYKIGETLASWKQDVEFLGGDMAALGIPASALGILQRYRRPF